MIWRAGATAGALIPVAGAALAADKGETVATSVPTVWHALGYPFEAGSMIAALCACVAVRFYVSHKDRAAYRWQVDAPVSALALMFTAAAVMRLRPDPAVALFLGTGFGALGAGIIAAALAYVQRLPGLGGPDTDTNRKDGA